MMEGCLACDLAAGRRELPGGVLCQTRNWNVSHCVGPLGLGTLIVAPRRHVVHVWELRDDEADELGELLRRAAQATQALTDPEQVYVCLWSHADETPGHIHFVVQPVDRVLMDDHGTHGPALQVAMFERGAVPAPADVERIAPELRRLLGQP